VSDHNDNDDGNDDDDAPSPDFFQLSPITKICRPTRAVKQSHDDLETLLKTWVMAQHCHDSSSSSSSNVTTTSSSFPQPVLGSSSYSMYVATEVAKQLDKTTDKNQSRPFDPTNPKDVVHFLEHTIDTDDNLSSSSSLSSSLKIQRMPALGRSSMPPWLGGRRQEQAVTEGTLLLGLHENTASALQKKWWWSLKIHCLWNRMTPSGAYKKDVIKSLAPPKENVKMTKGTTVTTTTAAAATMEPAEDLFTKEMRKSTQQQQQAQEIQAKKESSDKQTTTTAAHQNLRNVTKKLEHILTSNPKTKKPAATFSVKESKATVKRSFPAIVLMMLLSQDFQLCASIVSVLFIVFLYYQQQEPRKAVVEAWMEPEVNKMTRDALQRIQEAGGWEVTHLRDASVNAARTIPDDYSDNAVVDSNTGAAMVVQLQYNHLMNVIWPRVLEALQSDDRIEVSTTNQGQTILKWKGEGVE